MTKPEFDQLITGQAPADEKHSKAHNVRINGFCVMAAWHFLMLYTAVFNLSPWLDSGRHVWMQLALYASLAVSYMVIAFASHPIESAFFNRGKAMRWVSVLVISVIACAGTLMTVFSYGKPAAFQVLSYIVLGVGGALLIYPWLVTPNSSGGETISFKSLSLNMGLGSVIAIVISFIQSPLDYVIICVLPFLSNILYMVGPYQEDAEEKRIDALERAGYQSSDKLSEFIVSSIFFLIFGIVFGFIQGIYANDESIWFVLNDGWPLLGGIISALALFLIPRKYLRAFGTLTLQQVSCIVLFAGLFLSLYFTGPAVTSSLNEGTVAIGLKVAQALVLAGFNIFEFGFMIFAFTWAAKLKTRFTTFIGTNRFMLYIGLFLGLAIGFALNGACGGSTGISVLGTGAVVIVVTCLSLPFFRDMAPYNGATTKEENDLLDTLINQSDSPAPVAEPAMSEAEVWEARVNRIADQYMLSQREREVFGYLARGRNAAYIQQELFISVHTAKTHIANIYRKLNVHSMQEVLNMVEGSTPED